MERRRQERLYLERFHSRHPLLRIPPFAQWRSSQAADRGELGGACWAVISTRATTSIRDCISEARVHFLRDVHDLKDDFPQDEDLHAWAKEVKALYEEAVAWVAQDPDPGLSPRKLQQLRVAQQHAFEQRLWKLCQPSAHSSAPHHTLCERVERFL